jgi:hypothetical protein
MTTVGKLLSRNLYTLVISLALLAAFHCLLHPAPDHKTMAPGKSFRRIYQAAQPLRQPKRRARREARLENPQQQKGRANS